MSVAKLREATEKKGCQVVVWTTMVICLIGLTWSGLSCFFRPPGTGEEGQAANQVLLTVNGKSVTLAAFQQHMQDARSRVGGVVDPQSEFSVYAVSLADIVRVEVSASIAAARGVSLDDARALSMASQQFDAEIKNLKNQAIANKQLDANATDQQFAQFFEKQFGGTIADAKKRATEDLQAKLKDPSQRDATIDQFLRQALEESLYASTTVTEDEVKRSYDNYSFKYVSFDKQEMNDAQRKAQAEQALAEIKGGADFDAVTKKYMAQPPKEPTKLRRSFLDLMPYLKPLGDMKVGDVSGVITEPGSIYKIYKMVEYKSELPADYESNKVVYTNSFRQDKAQRLYFDAIEQGTKEAKLEWKSPGLQAVYKVYQTLTDQSLTAQGQIAQLTDVLENTVAQTNDPAGPDAAKYARFGAVQQLETRLPADKLSALLPKKIEVINDILVDNESVGLRLVLVDAYIKTGDNAGAVQSLKLAAENNTGFAPENEGYFTEINKKLNELETDKKITEQDAADVRNTLLDWSKQRAEEAQSQPDQNGPDPFAIDPKTGKTYGEEEKEKAAATGGGTGSTATTGGGTGAPATTGGAKSGQKGK